MGANSKKDPDTYTAAYLLNQEKLKKERRGPERRELEAEVYRENSKELFYALKAAKRDTEIAKKESISSQHLLEAIERLGREVPAAEVSVTTNESEDKGTGQRAERREPTDTLKVVLNDYTHIEYNGKSVHLKPTAAQILKYMSEVCREQDVEPRKAHNALALKAEPWRDLFRYTGLWNTLIVKGKKLRTRRLSVYP